MKRKDNAASQERISIKQMEEAIAGSGKRADAMRLDGFEALIHIKRARLVQTRRERARVAERHGEQSEAVQVADRRMALEHRYLVTSRAERDRLKAPTVERDEQVWQLHGYMRDQDGFPRARYTVALFPDPDGIKPALLTTRTNKQGYFRMKFSHTSTEDQDKGEHHQVQSLEAELGLPHGREQASPTEGVKINTNADEMERGKLNAGRQARLLALALRHPVYLGTQGSKQSGPTVQPAPLHPAPGMIAYRDITVDDAGDTGKRCHFATRLLGNSNSKELHNLDNEKPRCRLVAMRPDHRVYFLNEEQAMKLGYDYCGHCYGPEKSQRNRR